jgi:hypothetical protein
MTSVKLTLGLALVLGLVCTSRAREDGGKEQARPKLEDVVQIEFPKDGYSFTLAEAAKGVQLPYKIVVGQDYEGVIPLPNPPSYHEPAGPSGLHPREQIAGDKQLYCLVDFGLGAPPKEVVKALKKGTYSHSFEWDGRNWTGPSDFGNPKGKPFPAGTYEVTVTLRGKVVTEKGTVPYEISRKTKLVLK